MEWSSQLPDNYFVLRGGELNVYISENPYYHVRVTAEFGSKHHLHLEPISLHGTMIIKWPEMEVLGEAITYDLDTLPTGVRNALLYRLQEAISESIKANKEKEEKQD